MPRDEDVLHPSELTQDPDLDEPAAPVVMVRPDRVIAWRASTLTDDPAADLRAAVHQILGTPARVADHTSSVSTRR